MPGNVNCWPIKTKIFEVVHREVAVIDSPNYTLLCGFVYNFFSDLRFHHVHGKNARIINNGLTALRPRPLAEFNDAIVFSNRPLKDGEMFEIVLDSIVERWSGSIELGKCDCFIFF